MPAWFEHVPKPSVIDEFYRRRDLEQHPARRIMLSCLVLLLMVMSVVFGWYLYEWVR